jgi:mannose-1-phosphate guanylyltransferase/mannose-6-phosphate isomerase
MNHNEIFPVILCGGSGTRLWPRSRPDRPKPFLPLIGERTLFEQAINRVSPLRRPIIVTGNDFVELVVDQLEPGSEPLIIVEPEAKNTAAAIALAASLLAHDDLMLICPSDHHIADEGAFLAAARDAAEIARQGWLVCLAAEARAPETGFGYIRRGSPLVGTRGFEIAEFVEKPDQTTADAYVASGEYAWNTGIFVFRAGDFLTELDRCRLAMADQVRQAVGSGRASENRFHPASDPFSTIIAESVDYAVFENCDRAAVVVTDMGWSDIGSWPAIHAARPQDLGGNSVRGRADLFDCRNVLVDTGDKRVVAIGLENVAVVIDGNDVLLLSTDKAGRMGEIARQLIEGAAKLK